MNKLLKGRYDFKYFCEEILELEYNDHHEKIASVFKKNKRGVIVCPRGHGKTFTAIAYVLWYITYNHRREVVLVSSSRDQSTRVLEQIKTFVKDKPDLEFLKPTGEFLDLEDWQQTWSKMEIVTSTNCKVFVRPFNSSIRGLHVDLCICDDVLRDDKNTLSDEKAKYIFFNIVSPIVNTKKGSLFALGTPQTDIDLLAKLMKTEGYANLHLKAVDDGWTKPLWPSRFTIADLQRIRDEIGAFAFTKEYLTTTISGETSWFKENDIKKAISKDCTTFKRRENCAYFLGVDVAMSSSTKADFSVFTIIELNYESETYKVARIVRDKGLSTNKHIEIIDELDQDYQLDSIWIESNSISQGVVKEAIDKWPNKCEGIHMGGKNKPEMLGHLQAAFQKGCLQIPNDQELINELAKFRAYEKNGKYKIEGVGAHDDMVMSLAIAYENSLETGQPVSVGFV
jgi:hypothetical protein